MLASPTFALGLCQDPGHTCRVKRQPFLAGKSPPDFAPMNFEVDFKGRATVADLTDLGRRQMGF